MKKLKQLIFEHQHSFGLILLQSLFVVYLLFFHFYKSLQRIDFDIHNLFLIALSFLSLTALHTFIELGTHRSKRLYQSVMILIFILYEFMYLYHYRMGNQFDFGMLAQNWDELFNFEAGNLVLSSAASRLKLKDYVNITVLSFILIYYGIFKDKLKPREREYKVIQFTFAAIIFFTIITRPYYLYDKISYLTHSIYEFYIPTQSPLYIAAKSELENEKFPYIKNFKSSRPAKRPHIIIVAMESFNANFADSKSPQGVEYMPTFNSKIPQGVFFENFYGHSVQTAKGHFSILCGLAPLIKGKAMKQARLKLHCLPEILKNVGYQTSFIQGYGNVHFDNSYNFMKSIGFSSFEATDTSKLTAKQRVRDIWGFGIQDDYTYRQAFKKMDSLNKQNPDKPIFSVIATISNHMDFHFVPKHLRFFYKNPHGNYEHFVNSIRASDEFLKTFFAELSKREYLKNNTLVIITGDHSFPAGEHGNYTNASGSYSELFKTPLLFIWPGELVPRRVKERHSQIDIAPSILDLLGISTKTHFVGESVWHSNISKVIPLLHPYDGVHLGGIIGNLKYVYNVKSNRHTLYDLEKDPKETTNIYSSDHKLNGLFKEIVKQHYKNQIIIESNRVWK